ncbi:outer membrane lipoprotein carrier protein LolA [Pseudooceanicola sp. HF7]|uniref:LolA family protein n=1 Tax=Pseudooceanicola sp. HF7 TaxID=2721560 RepID=UPI001431C9A8|nr:outer membrane lipoprotein carrier protein LolA [Pseudooceanicola sp. HF7]NIZ10564.1 outer membrane lipoprotein carrier protein LolA [Pseudooceanicola sp. HF7]
MTRLTRLLAPAAALLALTVPAMAQPISLSALSNYFNGWKTAEAQFTQINQDGSVDTGTLYIKRPGRMRFEYAAPNDSLVLAGGGAVAIYDPKSNAGPNTYPLSKTPLSLILDNTVDLTRANMVTDHREDGPATVVRAQDPAHPEYGYIELVFTPDPIELRQWVVHDNGGTTTTVALGNLEVGKRLGDSMFDLRSEFQKDNGR